MVSMEKSMVGKSRNSFWFVILASFTLWVLLIFIFHSNFNISKSNSTTLLIETNPQFDRGTKISDKFVTREQLNDESRLDQEINSNPIVGEENDASCLGKYIYVHDIPKRFNEDLLKNCRTLSSWMDMCPSILNFGLGSQFSKSEKIFSKNGWYETNQFMLEVIFHNRMKQYKCLTKNSTLASAIYVPYYVGLDVARYLWSSDKSLKDSDSVELVKWVREKPEWKRMLGRDHFLVGGRITWDFRRMTEDVLQWGGKFMTLPESKNMTMLVIESSPWNKSDIAIPYPTYFHPSNDNEVIEWQSRMRRMKRRHLFSFVGGRRPDSDTSIRNEIFDQCLGSRKKCRLLECNPKANKCYKPEYVMKMFQSSVFCLQPTGDSLTRRSTFDAILAGCIPVFFHPGSAYVQYIWHLPKEYKQYSVFIPANDIKDRKVSIERILGRIPKSEVIAMRRKVISLIPRVIYADPRHKLETIEDAFDIAVRGVLERIDRFRIEIEQGKDSSFDVGEESTWKYDLFGTVGKHEWDPFFYDTSNVNRK